MLPDAERSADISLESSTFTSEEVETLHEQIQLLCEQIDSLHQLVKDLDSQLFEKQQQIEVLEQELARTNEELCRALISNQQKTRKLKQVSQQISANESLYKLLNVSNNLTIQSQEQKVEEATAKKAPTPYSAARQILDNSKELRNHSQQLISQLQEIKSRFIVNKANILKFKK